MRTWQARESDGGGGRGREVPGGIRSENEAVTLDGGPLTSFSQVLMQFSDQTEGNQAPGARGAITARVFLPQSSLELGTQLPGQLLPFQFSARA